MMYVENPRMRVQTKEMFNVQYSETSDETVKLMN